MKYEYDWDKIKKNTFKEKIKILENWKLFTNDNGTPFFNPDWITKIILNISDNELKIFLRKEEIKKRKEKILKILNNGK